MGLLDGSGDFSSLFGGVPLDVAYGGVLDPDTISRLNQARNQQGLLTLAANLMANSGPSRMPVPLGSTIGKSLLQTQQSGNDYDQNAMRSLLGGQQYAGARTQNALSGMTLQGYQNLQRMFGGGAPAASPGFLSGVSSAPASGGFLSGSQPPAPITPADASGPTATLLASPPGTSMKLPTSGGTTTQYAVDGQGNIPQGGAQLTLEDAPRQTDALSRAATNAKIPGAGGAEPLFSMPAMIQQYQLYATTPGMANLAQQTLSLIQKGLPEGAQIMRDGSIALRPGADQVYAGKSLAEKGYLQGQNGVYRFAPGYVEGQSQLTGATEWAKVAPQLYVDQNKSYTLERPGAVRIVNGRVVAQNPVPIKGVNPDGTPYETYIMPPTQAQGGSLLNPPTAAGASSPGGGLLAGQPAGGFLSGVNTGQPGWYLRSQNQPAIAAANAAPAPAPNAAPGPTTNAQGMPQWQTGLSPLQESSAKARGTQLEEYGQKLQTDATNSVNQQFLIDQMRRDSGNGAGWTPGRFAEWKGAARALLNGLGMSDAATDNALANYQAFQKNSVALTTAATRAVSPRAAVQEMMLIRESMPGAKTSEGGLRYIFDQFSANNDFLTAKNQAAETWRGNHGGTLSGFEAAWNQNISPFAFLAKRMSNDDYQAMASNLGKTPEGRVLLGKIIAETKTADQLGLFRGGGQ